VLIEGEQRRWMSATGVLVPDTQQVVVGPAGKMTPIAGPLQTADLLRMGKK